jgi:ribosomal protein S27AE
MKKDKSYYENKFTKPFKKWLETQRKGWYTTEKVQEHGKWAKTEQSLFYDSVKDKDEIQKGLEWSRKRDLRKRSIKNEKEWAELYIKNKRNREKGLDNVSEKVKDLLFKNSYASYKISSVIEDQERNLKIGAIKNYKITTRNIDDDERVMLTFTDADGSRKRQRIFKKAEEDYINKGKKSNATDKLKPSEKRKELKKRKKPEYPEYTDDIIKPLKKSDFGRKNPVKKEHYFWDGKKYVPIRTHFKLEDGKYVLKEEYREGYEEKIAGTVKGYYQTMKDGEKRWIPEKIRKERASSPKDKNRKTVTELNLERDAEIKKLTNKFNKIKRKARENWDLYKLYVNKSQKCSRCGGIVVSAKGGSRVCSKCGDVKGKILDYSYPKEWNRELSEVWGESREFAEEDEVFTEGMEFERAGKAYDGRKTLSESAKNALGTKDTDKYKKMDEKIKAMKKIDYIPRTGAMKSIEDRANDELKKIKRDHDREVDSIKEKYELRREKL